MSDVEGSAQPQRSLQRSHRLQVRQRSQHNNNNNNNINNSNNQGDRSSQAGGFNGSVFNDHNANSAINIANLDTSPQIMTDLNLMSVEGLASDVNLGVQRQQSHQEQENVQPQGQQHPESTYSVYQQHLITRISEVQDFIDLEEQRQDFSEYVMRNINSTGFIICLTGAMSMGCLLWRITPLLVFGVLWLYDLYLLFQNTNAYHKRFLSIVDNYLNISDRLTYILFKILLALYAMGTVERLFPFAAFLGGYYVCSFCAYLIAYRLSKSNLHAGSYISRLLATWGIKLLVSLQLILYAIKIDKIYDDISMGNVLMPMWLFFAITTIGVCVVASSLVFRLTQCVCKQNRSTVIIKGHIYSLMVITGIAITAFIVAFSLNKYFQDAAYTRNRSYQMCMYIIALYAVLMVVTYLCLWNDLHNFFRMVYFETVYDDTQNEFENGSTIMRNAFNQLSDLHRMLRRSYRPSQKKKNVLHERKIGVDALDAPHYVVAYSASFFQVFKSLSDALKLRKRRTQVVPIDDKKGAKQSANRLNLVSTFSNPDQEVPQNDRSPISLISHDIQGENFAESAFANSNIQNQNRNLFSHRFVEGSNNDGTPSARLNTEQRTSTQQQHRSSTQKRNDKAGDQPQNFKGADADDRQARNRANVMQLRVINLDDQSEDAASHLSTANCVICFDNQCDAVLQKCGHGGICFKCAIGLLSKKKDCHLCRQKIESVLKIDLKNKKDSVIPVISKTNFESQDVVQQNEVA